MDQLIRRFPASAKSRIPHASPRPNVLNVFSAPQHTIQAAAIDSNCVAPYAAISPAALTTPACCGGFACVGAFMHVFRYGLFPNTAKRQTSTASPKKANAESAAWILQPVIVLALWFKLCNLGHKKVCVSTHTSGHHTPHRHLSGIDCQAQRLGREMGST